MKRDFKQSGQTENGVENYDKGEALYTPPQK